MAKKPKRITPEGTTEVIQLFEEGVGRNKIAQLTGYSRNSVDKILIDNNVFIKIANRVEQLIDSKVNAGQYFIHPTKIMTEAIELGYVIKPTTPVFHVITNRIRYHNYTRRSLVGVFEAPKSPVSPKNNLLTEAVTS